MLTGLPPRNGWVKPHGAPTPVYMSLQGGLQAIFELSQSTEKNKVRTEKKDPLFSRRFFGITGVCATLCLVFLRNVCLGIESKVCLLLLGGLLVGKGANGERIEFNLRNHRDTEETYVSASIVLLVTGQVYTARQDAGRVDG